MSTAYIDALKMLGRRELSEAQVRQRLAQREHGRDEIEAAVERLKSERAIDDARVAAAMARTESVLKRRGKLRVKRRLEGAGLAPETVRHAMEDVVGQVDDDALLEAAIARRLRNRERAGDDHELQRLYQHLIRQGFEPEKVSRALRTRRPLRADGFDTDL